MDTFTKIRQAQRRLGLVPTGAADDQFDAQLREFQRRRGLIVTGELNNATWRALEALPREGLVPSWYGQPTQSVVVALAIGSSDEANVRRYQSACRLPVTGVIDEATAISIGG